MGVVAYWYGEVVCHLRESVAFDLDDDAYLQKIGKSVEEEFKQKAAISDDQLLGVGIAVSGLDFQVSRRISNIRTDAWIYRKNKDADCAKYIPYTNQNGTRFLCGRLYGNVGWTVR